MPTGLTPFGIAVGIGPSPDGQRFLMLQPVGQEQPPVTQIHVVLNWAEELKRLVPSKKYP